MVYTKKMNISASKQLNQGIGDPKGLIDNDIVKAIMMDVKNGSFNKKMMQHFSTRQQGKKTLDKMQVNLSYS